MKNFIDGFIRFKRDVFPKRKQLFERLAGAQSPEALFITCADSRIVPDLIMQTEPGDLFICRNAGNIVPPYGEVQGGVSATIEYAVAVLNVSHIIVCGHTDCGAMKGILKPETLDELPTVKSWLVPWGTGATGGERELPGAFRIRKAACADGGERGGAVGPLAYSPFSSGYVWPTDAFNCTAGFTTFGPAKFRRGMLTGDGMSRWKNTTWWRRDHVLVLR